MKGLSEKNLKWLKEQLCDQHSGKKYPCRNCYGCSSIEEAEKRDKKEEK